MRLLYIPAPFAIPSLSSNCLLFSSVVGPPKGDRAARAGDILCAQDDGNRGAPVTANRKHSYRSLFTIRILVTTGALIVWGLTMRIEFWDSLKKKHTRESKRIVFVIVSGFYTKTKPESFDRGILNLRSLLADPPSRVKGC